MDADSALWTPVDDSIAFPAALRLRRLEGDAMDDLRDGLVADMVVG